MSNNIFVYIRYNNTNKKGTHLAKITLDIDNKDIDTVLLILNNLKSGLINNITTDKKNITSSNINKKNIKKQILEDDFIPKPVSNGKYLSSNAYKQKLQNKIKG